MEDPSKLSYVKEQVTSFFIEFKGANGVDFQVTIQIPDSKPADASFADLPANLQKQLNQIATMMKNHPVTGQPTTIIQIGGVSRKP